MDRLWAPWRLGYIQNIDSDKDAGCIFCIKPKSDDDQSNLILHRGRHAFVMLNLFPYNNGHLLIVPYRHTADIGSLSNDESSEMWELIVRGKNALAETLRPDGFNVGLNLGRTAGAGIADHLHAHIVPRWNGDANFMQVTGDTKVISQGIQDSYNQLHQCFARATA